MTPHDVLAAYGGLMLKVRYEVDGTERSFIQYLPQACAGGAARRDCGGGEGLIGLGLDPSATLRSTPG